MLMPKKERFLEEVLSYIKFPFDRENIKTELESHIVEKIDDYMEQGYDVEKAEELAINDIGDAKEIGMELNKEHNALLGWLWKITNGMVVLFIIGNLFFVGVPFFITFFSSSPINDIDKSSIVYQMDIDEQVKLDNTVIHFTNIVYQDNGELNIFFEHYDTKLWGTGWSLGTIGEITDNLGNTYRARSACSAGIKTKCIHSLDNFSKKADTLIISYDSYNRKYKVEISLQVGENDE